MNNKHELPISEETRKFLESKHLLFINGEWIESSSGEIIPVVDPATEEKIAEVQSGTKDDIDLAVRSARNALEAEWSKIPSHDRAQILHRLSDEIEANFSVLSELEVLDNGMPMQLAQYSIASHGVTLLRYFASWAPKIHGKTIPVSPGGVMNGDSLTYTKREPIGVVGAIVPWNSPLIFAILKLAPALAAGCTVVLKPAELTPLTALYFAHLIEKSGIPKGVVNIVTGFGETAGDALAKHEDVDKITFTGSTEVGKKIVSSSVGNLKKVTLELGGKSPVVVFNDADLEKTIPGVARACFFLQGQNCMAGTRVFVHEDIHDELVEGVKNMAEAFQIGHGLIQTNDFGPLISGDQRNRVMKYIKQGISEGATLVCGGHETNEKGFFIEPTIFTDVTADMAIARDEIFGPVLCIEKFNNESLEAIAKRANETTYGLSGSVWTNDIATGHRMAALIDSGQVSINCHAAVDPAIPFGGNKQSGWGREFGEEGLGAYLKTKATTVIY
ncbi:MAG: aldehyde dehydrogenase family protein [Gammaproteobacteria bacterium]|jgi:phenylacetaldehyde dehydrogenase|nr:aldehyde dehydrogenase [Gammaproteobacteria bacterium]MDP6146172.1 aldehyde dehydrogenase family protein [Gammaproteobacteria bacterium]HJL80592.1 aldehyde dehydrogenase family protein [Gammaproteobacteria bacterium]HJM09050.1 aldehyde dehydrogenase family protein [Gammaproteobacteria bacterium]HJN00138.1 aldehyde dehydrogenase family protein [Gammaproteobacteria bacterium]|tara:strand:- start:20464 stop:21969 length:1506 start_codon:yes stop_codon:yes gene_type:complete